MLQVPESQLFFFVACNDCHAMRLLKVVFVSRL
jgi:hypothetical protein